MSITLFPAAIAAVVSLCIFGVTQLVAARQRERDRQLQLRRDVYMEAAIGLAASFDSLRQHARPDVPLGSISSNSPSWLYKLHLVADADTIIAFNAAQAAVASAMLDILSHRIALAETDSEILATRTSIESLQRFQEQMRSDSRAIMGESPSERGVKRLEWLKEQIDESWKHVNTDTDKLSELVVEHSRRLRMLAERSVSSAVEIQKVVRAALLKARAELEIDLDASRVEAAAAQLDAVMAAKISDTLKLLD